MHLTKYKQTIGRITRRECSCCISKHFVAEWLLYLYSGRTQLNCAKCRGKKISQRVYTFTQFLLRVVAFYQNVTMLHSGFGLLAIANPFVVCNVPAPYSGVETFGNILYYSHPLTSVQDVTEIVPGEALRRGR